jgi:exocyst complex component 4
MLDLVRKNTIHYDFDDLKALLNLQCGVDQSGKDGSAPNGADGGGVPLSAGGMDRNRRQYNEYLIVRFLSLSSHLFPQPCRKASHRYRRRER